MGEEEVPVGDEVGWEVGGGVDEEGEREGLLVGVLGEGVTSKLYLEYIRF